MSSRHLVDPQLQPLLGALPSFELSLQALTQIRALMPPASEPSADVIASERLVPGPEGAPEVRVVVYEPRRRQGLAPAYVHMHGGGYVLGSPHLAAARNQALASAIGCVVVSVDYRLSPEAPFPGPIEDCYAGLKWLHEHAEELGVDRKRIAIGGESAGGGLAAALGLLARDRGEVPVAFQLLVYPMLDDRTVVAEPHPYAGEFVWTPANNRFGWTALLGGEPGGEDVSPYAAAARAGDLSGLPPTYIAVGALDLLLAEDVAYAQRLLRAGVPTELHVYPGAFHGFDLVAHAEVAQRFERELRDALRRGLRAA
ncbi:Acetyl esterase/lipase [Nannocystis exedens]|uniref:Acetyl esterase/lipase n=1 Tax=Nannocystis exedens TaxID=54 RepID=A0A1I1WTA4_9BACT|nr:alpha/beta hydrolase [Nannocystis exedens]PCC71023.1 arylesterase [Nannocystis exedens]SFD98231.1 Acetyl esterase/lipase [Nannocystis exedens]